MGRTRANRFFAGIAALALGTSIACGGGDGDSGDPTATSEASGAQATASASATNTAATTSTVLASPTPGEGTPTVTPTATSTPGVGTPTVSEAATTTVAGAQGSAAPTAVPAPATAAPVVAAPEPTAFVPAPNGPAVARMRIASLGVDYPIEQLGTTKNGAELDTPHNATGAIGWYSIGHIPDFAVPGTGGNAMFSAHINYNGANGPFANLAGISSGAEIAVTLADGSVLRYEVFAKHGYVVNANYVTAERPLINMEDIVYTPNKPPGEEWITLMTCSCEPGRIIIAPGGRFGDCVDRDVVLARRVG